MFESELVLGILIATWIAYELWGRVALDWISGWTTYIRIGGGILVIGYLWWTLGNDPETTLDLAKQLLKDGRYTKTNTNTNEKEKRNVSGLMKKRIAASQEWKCGSCKQTLDETYEVDHRIALFNGGSNDPSNLVALCPHCHRKKTVDERLDS